MTSHDDFSIGHAEPPSPSPQLRDAAIEHALALYDRKHQLQENRAAGSQGVGGLRRLMARTIALVLPTHGSRIMPHTSHVFIGSLAALLIGSAVWINLETPFGPV